MRRWTAKTWLAAASILLAAVPAWAEQWPEHGFFSVRRKVTREGRQSCEMQLSLNIDKQLFALVWVAVEDRMTPLIVNYMSGDPHIAKAERVIITIDGVEMLAFTPFSRSVEPEITALAGPVRGEAAIHAWEAMQQASAKATWLTVAAGDTLARVPAQGLRETLADFAECRRQNSL